AGVGAGDLRGDEPGEAGGRLRHSGRDADASPPPAGHARSSGHEAKGGKTNALVHTAAEVAGRGPEHEALDPLRMPPPDQLGDGAAHRVPGGDEAPDAER